MGLFGLSRDLAPRSQPTLDPMTRAADVVAASDALRGAFSAIHLTLPESASHEERPFLLAGWRYRRQLGRGAHARPLSLGRTLGSLATRPAACLSGRVRLRSRRGARPVRLAPRPPPRTGSVRPPRASLAPRRRYGTTTGQLSVRLLLPGAGEMRKQCAFARVDTFQKSLGPP